MSRERRLTAHEREVIDAWREKICNHGEEIDPENELDWTALFIGFAIGMGLSIESATDYALYDEHAYPCEHPAVYPRFV